MRIKHRYYNRNVHAVTCLPSSRCWGCLIMWWWMATHLTNGEFQLASHSWSVMSSIIKPVDEMFGSAEVAPPTICRAGWCGGKMATLWWLRSKFLPLPVLLPLGPILSRLIKEVTTSTKRSSHSNLRVGGAHSMTLSLGLAEDSSACCLLAWGPSTWLNMVVGDGWWPPSGSFISRPFIMSSQVIFTNS